MSEQTTRTDVRAREDVLADAVRVLTEAARLTRPIYAPAAAEQDPDLVYEASAATVGTDGQESARDVQDVRRYVETGRREPEDFAEFLTQALVAAAANVGGVGAVLAGRPGSWEADAVRQLLVGTVGEDEEYLLEHRTEPVVVRLLVDEILNDVGVWQGYDDAARAIAVRADQVPLDAEDQEQRLDAIAVEEERLEQDRQQAWAAYGDALRANVIAAAARRRGLTVPVQVTVDLDTFRLSDERTGSWDLEAQLVQEAIEATPQPQAPAVPPSGA